MGDKIWQRKQGMRVFFPHALRLPTQISAAAAEEEIRQKKKLAALRSSVTHRHTRVQD